MCMNIENRRDCLEKYIKSGYLYNALVGWFRIENDEK